MNWADTILIVAGGIMSMTFVLIVVRIIIGPNLANRVIAMDCLSVVAIGIIVTFSILTRQKVYIDVAIILALVSFLGTVAFAYYLQRKGGR